MAFPRFSIVHPSSCCCLRDTIINTKSKQDRHDQTSLLSRTHRNAPALAHAHEQPEVGPGSSLLANMMFVEARYGSEHIR